jgi:GxxExxY protein
MGQAEHNESHRELTGRIIGAAQTVHTALKTGLDEKLYENALCVEFAELGLSFSQQKEFPVFYKDQFIGKLIPDLVVEDQVIVDAKVVSAFCNAHTAQVLSYLNISDLEVGLLLNFKTPSLQIKRVTRFENNLCKSVKSVVKLQEPPNA